MKESQQYRPEIDGLRAIAVSGVIIYHAGVKRLGGGYAGVDVFFVISGYLITKYIAQRMQDDKFSLMEFYERRVRRIIPALFFLLLFAVAASLFTLLPGDLYRFAESVVATVCFVPNILFWRESGYFGTAASYKPLLHMWSLGVEEQFYIFFPIAMWILSRWARRAMVLFLSAACLISFALSVYGVAHQPTAAFYLMPSRAWELLLGSLIGVQAFPQLQNAVMRNVLSAGGLAAVIISFFVYTSETLFPGLAAVLPCLGTALVIYANEESLTVAGFVLSLRPVVAIGLISYSLYLWHWPLLVFGSQYLGRALTGRETALAVLLAVLAAAFSWKFVEQPFRRRIVGATRRSLFWKSAMAAAFLMMLAATGIVTRGFPRRLTPQALRYARAVDDLDRDLNRCVETPLTEITAGNLCRLGSQAARPEFVVWGDSHAGAIAPAFKALAEDTGIAGWLATRKGCAPLLGVEIIDQDRESGSRDCSAFNDAVAAAIEQYDIRTIYLVGRWQLNALGRDSSEIADGRHQVYERDSETQGALSLPENLAVFERGLGRTLSRAKRDGRQVVLVMDVPYTAVDTPSYLAKGAMRGRVGQDVSIESETCADREKSMLDTLLLRLTAQYHVLSIEPKGLLCSQSKCMIASQGKSLYRDSHHLSKYGALKLVDLLRPSFSKAGNPQLH